MKYKDLIYQIQSNSEFRKWYKKFWDATLPKRKLRIFIDRNIPYEAVKELEKVKNFKIMGIAESDEEDRLIFDKARKLKAAIITKDEDFWNDRKFPLKQSPGILIVKGKTAGNVIDSLAWFFGLVGIFDAERKIAGWLEHTKWKISKSGYISKILNYKSKVEIEKVDY